MPGEEHRRLSRRVAAADDRDRIVPADQRLRLRGRVIDARLLEVLQARHVKAAVPHAGRYDDRPGRDRAAILKPHLVVTVAVPDGHRFGGNYEPGTEFLRLENCPFSELSTGDSRRESQVVLDP